jgi:DNA-binding NarL/FixJ family response regulator
VRRSHRRPPPDKTREALGAISGTGRQALAEMRRLLGMLRSPTAGPELAPVPGTSQLSALLEQTKAAGVPVSFSQQGPPAASSVNGADLAVYRVVQEALTNVRRHGGPGVTAAVTIRYTTDAITVDVTDDGRGAAAPLSAGRKATAGHGGADSAGHGLMVMDVRMPRLDGVQATRQICAAGDRPRVLMLTTFDLDEYAFAALKAGASGFLLKDVPSHELLFAIRSVHSGDAVVAPSTTKRLIGRFAPLLPAPGAEAPPDLAVLTDREREVLVHVAAGLSNTEIAGRLFLAEATIKTHVGRILSKLGLRDRVQAVVLAYESGLVKPRQP